jgi:hypothetical protein
MTGWVVNGTGFIVIESLLVALVAGAVADDLFNKFDGHGNSCCKFPLFYPLLFKFNPPFEKMLDHLAHIF